MDALDTVEVETEIEVLRRKLDEAEQTLRALQRGEADALVVEGGNGPQVYTLKSAAEPYRTLVEQMREGALTLSQQGVILYCNEAFARIAGASTAEITGLSVLTFICRDDFETLAGANGCRGRETILKRKGGGQATVMLSSTPLRVDDQPLISAVVTDLTRQQLRQRYQAIVESIGQPIYSLNSELVIQNWNPGAERLYGYKADEIVGRPERDLCTDEEFNTFETLERNVRNTGQPATADTSRRRKDGATVHVIFCLAPLRDGDGHLSGYAAIAYDITERKSQERMRQLLMGELNHRVKNTLAMVQSIARFTERKSTSLEDFSISFGGRINALASAHNILTATSWQSVDLRSLLSDQLLLNEEERGYTYSGASAKDVKLEPQVAISLALVLHELGTNAQKYGAWSVNGGHVRLTWETSDSGNALKLRWQETGGPKVSPPLRRGFGSFIIEESLTGVEGRTAIRFEPEGLVCDIELPLGKEEPVS